MKEVHNRLDLDYMYLIPNEGIINLQDLLSSKEIFKKCYDSLKNGFLKITLDAYSLLMESINEKLVNSHELDNQKKLLGPFLLPKELLFSFFLYSLLNEASPSLNREGRELRITGYNLEQVRQILKEYAERENISIIKAMFGYEKMKTLNDLELIDYFFILAKNLIEKYSEKKFSYINAMGGRSRSLYLTLLPEIFYRFSLIGVDPKILVLSKGNEFFSVEYFQNLIKDISHEEWDEFLSSFQGDKLLTALKINIIKNEEQEFANNIELLLATYREKELKREEFLNIFNSVAFELIDFSIKANSERFLDIILNNYSSVNFKSGDLDFHETIEIKHLSRAMNVAIIRGNEEICIKLIDRLFFGHFPAASAEILADIIFFAPDNKKDYLLSYIAKNKELLDQHYFNLSEFFQDDRKILITKYMLPRFKYMLSETLYMNSLANKAEIIERIIGSNMPKEEKISVLDYLDSEALLDMPLFSELMATSADKEQVRIFMNKYLVRLKREREEILKDPEASEEELELMINSFPLDERAYIRKKREEYIVNPNGDFWGIKKLLEEDIIVDFSEDEEASKKQKGKKKKKPFYKDKKVNKISATFIENKKPNFVISTETSNGPDDPDSGAGRVIGFSEEQTIVSSMVPDLSYVSPQTETSDQSMISSVTLDTGHEPAKTEIENSDQSNETPKTDILAQVSSIIPDLSYESPQTETSDQSIVSSITLDTGDEPLEMETKSSGQSSSIDLSYESPKEAPYPNHFPLVEMVTLLPCEGFFHDSYYNIVPFFLSCNSSGENIYIIGAPLVQTNTGNTGYSFIKEKITSSNLFVEASELLSNGLATYCSPSGEVFFNLPWISLSGRILIAVSNIPQAGENRSSTTNNHQESQEAQTDEEANKNKVSEEQKTSNRSGNLEQEKGNFKELNMKIKTALEINVDVEDRKVKEKRESMEEIKALENSTIAKINYDNLLELEKYDFPIISSFFGGGKFLVNEYGDI